MTLPLPLQGIRVLDLGMFWAGPYSGRLLADMGAEVIKVEGPRRPDPLRIVPRGLFPDGEPGEQPWNRSGMINERNRNKLGISLDLAHPHGKELFKALTAISDVVVENFSARVMPRLGLDYAVLRDVNPRLVMVSIASQGLSGPERDYVSIDPILQALSGLSLMTGPPGAVPNVNALFSDPLAAVLATGGALAGLLARQQTGQGVHIDCSQREMLATAIGSAVMDYTMNDRVPTTHGNDDPNAILQGCFPCRGERGWVTISIHHEAEWQRLCEVLGHPAWTRKSRFTAPEKRRQHRQEISQHLAAWTQRQTKFEVTQQLQAAGIAAGPILNAKELFQHEQLQARGFFELCTHPEAGTHPYCSRPMQFTKTPLHNHRPAPCFGQHNNYVFGELLGLSAAEIADLTRQEIISTQPLVPMAE